MPPFFLVPTSGTATGFVSGNGLQPLIVEPALLGPPRSSLGLLMRRHRWVITGFGLVVASMILLLWARTRPGYDPYGWLVWGYQTLHLTLDLGGAPSWKPLPYLFTVPYALAGHYELWLWLITAVAVSLAGSVFAGRIAYRVTSSRSAELRSSKPLGRYAPVVAAMFAGVGLLGLEDYMHYILSAQSDPMIVTFCLAGIDMYLCGRHRWAFAFGVLPRSAVPRCGRSSRCTRSGRGSRSHRCERCCAAGSRWLHSCGSASPGSRMADRTSPANWPCGPRASFTRTRSVARSVASRACRTCPSGSPPSVRLP